MMFCFYSELDAYGELVVVHKNVDMARVFMRLSV